ncbi:MAG: GAF domain-containing protein [Acidobacteriota bacterium]
MSDSSLNEVEKRVHSILDERFADLSQQIDSWLKEARTQGETIQGMLNNALKQPFLRDGLLPEGVPGTDATGPLGDLAEFARDVECLTDQARILSRLLSGASALAPRVVLFIVKGNSLRGWSARGFGDEFNPRTVVRELGRGDLLGTAFATCQPTEGSPSEDPDNEEIVPQPVPPTRMLAVPLWVRDRVAAILYADTTGDPWYPEALNVMTSLAALSLEALPARTRHPRPAGPPARAARASSGPHGQPARTAPAPVTPGPAGQAPNSEVVEEARRFARLLVSEILLYNAEAVEEGRRRKDLYERLKDDIDRSHQMFEERIGPKLSDAMQFFRAELIQTLAKGDESAITLPWG